jgi:hypothetical protein
MLGAFFTSLYFLLSSSREAGTSDEAMETTQTFLTKLIFLSKYGEYHRRRCQKCV